MIKFDKGAAFMFLICGAAFQVFVLLWIWTLSSEFSAAAQVRQFALDSRYELEKVVTSVGELRADIQSMHVTVRSIEKSIKYMKRVY